MKKKIVLGSVETLAPLGPPSDLRFRLHALRQANNLDMPGSNKAIVSASKAKSPSTGSAEAPGRRKSATSVSSKKSTSTAKIDTPKSKKSGSSPSSAKSSSTANVGKPGRKASVASASTAKSDSAAKLEKQGRRKSSVSASSAKSTSTAKSDSAAKLDKQGRRKSSVSASSAKSTSTAKSSDSAPSKDDVQSKKDKVPRTPTLDEVSKRVMFPGEKTVSVPMVSKLPSNFRVFGTKSRYAKVMRAVAAQARYRGKVLTLLIAIAILLPLLAAALVWYFLSPPSQDKHVAVCLTVDCRHFGEEISAAINQSADPCDNFHSFVCGAWDDPKRQETTEARMMNSAAELALKEIEADHTQGNKATQFYQSCIRANEHKKENLKAFTEMRRSLGLFWPEQQSHNVHPLDAMVNLAINWDMNFLFDLSTVAVRNSTALLISRGPLDNGWELSIKKRRSLQHYKFYLEQHLEILGVSDALVNMSAADLLSLETAILDAKLEFLYDAPVQEWFSLGTMGTKTPALPADLWINLLVKHDRVFSWTAESIVIAEDVKILENLEKLLKSLGPDKLIIGLSWIFIQTHLWAVYGEPSIRFHGVSDDHMKLKRHGCVAYVESRLGLLSIWKTMNERFGLAANRLHIYSFLHRVNENAKHLINDLTWMDDKSKRTAFLKLDKMTRVILPGSKYFTKEDTEELYSVFPDMTGKTFLENLLNASQVYRELRSHDHFADIYSVRMFTRLGRESYLYLPNIMSLAFGDLDAPVFYNNATLAIRYGGLGSFAARQIIKAFDEVGVMVDEEGNSGLWLGPAPATVHSEKSQCDVRARSGSPGSRPLRFFPGIPGLEIAFQGYVSAVARDYRGLEDYKVAHLEAFTDDQIFFLAYCYTICAKRRQTGGDECNVPLKNFAPFAAAYKCAEDSPMNPPNKCTFFPLRDY